MRANLIAALTGTLCVVGCGGGGGGGGGTTAAGEPNVQAVAVDSGPSGIAGTGNLVVNTLYTTVTICVPGTGTCQQIDHIQIDTGSSGLRILSTLLTLSLPLKTDSNGSAIAECVHFVDGSSWGSVRLADIKIAGESADNQEVQVIGDGAYSTVPSSCLGTGTAENSVSAFGANGVLGVGPFVQDCGPACEQAGGATYFICTGNGACTDSAMPLAMQLTNPVTAFATDNNGVIIELPSVSGTAPSVNGTLLFGIGTRGNNGLGSAKVLTLDNVGALTTTYKAQTLATSFIDSGSNAYYFPDSSIAVCGSSTRAPGFFCPATTLNLSGTLMGTNGVSTSLNFSVANADSLFSTHSTVAAAVSLAAPSTGVGANGSAFSGADTFDWGLPFYFGRNVYTAIENQNTSAGMGPYFAF